MLKNTCYHSRLELVGYIDVHEGKKMKCSNLKKARESEQREHPIIHGGRSEKE
jgi:hypothetical protein